MEVKTPSYAAALMEHKLILMLNDLLNDCQKNLEQGSNTIRQKHVSSPNNKELLNSTGKIEIVKVAVGSTRLLICVDF